MELGRDDGAGTTAFATRLALRKLAEERGEGLTFESFERCCALKDKVLGLRMKKVGRMPACFTVVCNTQEYLSSTHAFQSRPKLLGECMEIESAGKGLQHLRRQCAANVVQGWQLTVKFLGS